MKKLLQRLARATLRPVFERLPAKWRFTAYSRAIRCDDNPSPKIVLKLAETREELEACFRLLHDAYVDAGFMKPDPSELRATVYHALPTTSTLLCRYGDRVVGTISLIRESAMGFPMQRVFDLADIRETGGQIAEVSALAIDRKFRSASGRILMPMLKFMYEYATRQFDTRHLVIAVNPRHIGFYEAILCFHRLKQKAVAHYDFVNGAPAVGAHLDLEKDLIRFKRRYSGLPPEKNLHRYFTEVELKNLHWPVKRFYTTTDPVMVPSLIDYFFNQKTQAFEHLRLRELMLLHSIYDLPEYKSVLPPVPDDAPRSEMRRRTHRRFSVVCPGEFSTRLFGIRKTFPFTVFEASASGFRARATTHLPVGATGTVIVEMGANDWSVMMVTILRLGSQDKNIALIRIDEDDLGWRKFVAALGKARTAGELEDATRFV